jgi:hypothetical protein
MTEQKDRNDIPDNVYNRIYKVDFKGPKSTATIEEAN